MSDSAASPAPNPVDTPEDFLRMVRASELVEPARMQEVEAALGPWKAARGPIPDPSVRALVDSHLLTAWQIGKLCERRSDGFLLGKCRLLEPLGKGGMGNVYLAEHTTLRSRVAVKVLRGPPARDDAQDEDRRSQIESLRKRFAQEARVAFRLRHDNIARALHLDTFEDRSGAVVNFIVMDVVDGVDLEKRVKTSGRLDVRDAADFIRQAAVGLQYAHGKGLVHRDIKPANLMVDSGGHLTILDFGLAQLDDFEVANDACGPEPDNKVVGTPDFMSPEQAGRQRVDHRSDIYSLGCTFSYLLTGRAPFEDTATGATGIDRRRARILAHLKTPAPNVLDVRPDVPVEIADLLLRMMQKSPDARPQSAREVVDSLAAWLEAHAEVTAGEPASRGGSAAGLAVGTPAAPGPKGDAFSGPRLATGSSAGPLVESDVHALSHSDAPRMSSHSRSTGSMPAETVPDGAIGDLGISIDTSPGPAKPAAKPAASAARVPSPRRKPAGGGAAAQRPAPAAAVPRHAWLFRRACGVPLVGWLSIAAAILAATMTAVTWSLIGGQTAGTADDEEETMTIVPRRTDGTAGPKPKPGSPAGRRPGAPRPAPKPKPKPDGEPSPLDKVLQSAGAAAAAPQPAAATDAGK
jgi:serine/threonine protein kinase